MDELPRCEFCGAPDPELDPIGITFGMYGLHYAFCLACLAEVSAEEFWRRVFEGQNYAWPPKRMPNFKRDPFDMSGYGGFTKDRSPAITPADRERRKLTHKMRLQVFERDGHKCRSCGSGVNDGAILHADHIYPISKGGKTTIVNLQTLCAGCNLGKGTSDLATDLV